jgi:hypothetical protein
MRETSTVAFPQPVSEIHGCRIVVSVVTPLVMIKA